MGWGRADIVSMARQWEISHFPATNPGGSQQIFVDRTLLELLHVDVHLYRLLAHCGDGVKIFSLCLCVVSFYLQVCDVKQWTVLVASPSSLQ